MNEDTSRDYKTFVSSLEALQITPGDTAREKFNWIGILASREPNATENFQKFLQELSPDLQSLLQVEIAVKHKRHEDITSALKSNNPTIVRRALKASWFFNGGHEIVDVAYFCERIFPFVSLRTRNRIIKTLARRIKNPEFAQEIFTTVVSTYNIETALPLAVACDNANIFCSFLHKHINHMSTKILKKLFFKNPELGQLFFQFFVDSYQRYKSEFIKIFEKFKYLLSKAIKNNPLILVQITNLSYSNELYFNQLSNTCAKRFLYKALEEVIKNPVPYINLIPIKIFNAALKKKFPDLINNPFLHECYKNDLFNILIHYPEERNLEVNLKTYKDICSGKLVDIENVTSFVLRLLPVKKRYELAREKKSNARELMHNNTEWICYFPIKKAISYIKLKLNKTSDFLEKIQYVMQMIHACDVNNDENELYTTLKYIIEEGYLVSDNVEIYKAATFIFIMAVKPLYLSERNGLLIFHIIQMFYERHGYVDEKILYGMIQHRLINDKSIEDLIEMLLKTNENYAPTFIMRNVGQEYLQYYRKFLLNVINVMQTYATNWEEKLQQEVVKEQQLARNQQRQKSERRKNYLRKEQGELREDKCHKKIAVLEIEISTCKIKYFLCRLVVAIYDFNENYKKYGVQLMSIKDYPWLMNAICIIMRSKKNLLSGHIMRSMLRKHELELYRSWFLSNTSKNIENVTSGAALNLLKKNFQSVLDNWEEYLMDCKRHYCQKHVQHFVRAIRWYKDIPIKFAERCVSDLREEDTEEMSSALIILSLLLDANSLEKLINPLLLACLETGINKRKFVHVLHFVHKFSNLSEFI